MAGTLYLVATPIGNLEDLTYRAVRTLGEVDFVAAEDTRVSGKLLHYLEISKPLVSYHEHNKKQRGPELVERILAGENCALVTDAGMPAIRVHRSWFPFRPEYRAERGGKRQPRQGAVECICSCKPCRRERGRT